ncbi:MAG: O-antigen ligase family protein, partial [Gallionella sp.]|nr:O-antigen ligase family protein [Gallionella sp.]
IPRIPLALLILALGALFFGFLSAKVSKSKMSVYLWLALVMLFAFVRIQEIDLLANVTRGVNFMIGLLLLKIYWSENRIRLESDLLFLLLPMAFQCIATFAISYFAPGLFTLIQSDRQLLYTLIGVFNFSVPLATQGSFMRPMGFFWEPGVFQLYLNVLLFLLFARQAKWHWILATVAAIFLTQSTTGIATASIQTAYFSIVPIFTRGLSTRRLVMLFVILVAIPVFYPSAEQNIAAKLTGDRSGSTSARSYDLEVAVDILAEHPIVGIGFNDRAYLNYLKVNNTDTSTLSDQDQNGRYNTNGVIVVLFSLGLPLGGVYLLSIFRQRLFDHRLIFGAILLLSLLA